MRITKFGHACARIEHDGTVLVIDPGSWSEVESVEGASAVLVTHEHDDHLDVDNLRAADAPVYTIDAVAEKIAANAPDLSERVTVVSPGDELDLGLPVKVVGEWHAVIHEDLPRFRNSGYLVHVGDVRVYHPGDAFTPPQQRLDLLLAPIHAPWSKTAEVIDFVKTVGAPRTVAIHDGLLNDRGLKLVQRLVGDQLAELELEYMRVKPGTDVAVR